MSSANAFNLDQLPNDKIYDQSKLKAFVDKKKTTHTHTHTKLKFMLGKVENI